MQVTFDLDEEHVAAIEAAFGLTPGAVTENQATVDTFAKLAAMFYANWASGKVRYRSLTDMQLDIVQELYETLMPAEAPSSDFLYNRLNMPPGQAAYIARILTNKDVPRWRAVGLKELRSALADMTAHYAGLSDVDAKNQFAQQDISQRAFRELIALCNTLKRLEPTTFIMAEAAGSVGDYRRVKMLVTTLRRVFKHMLDHRLGE